MQIRTAASALVLGLLACFASRADAALYLSQFFGNNASIVDVQNSTIIGTFNTTGFTETGIAVSNTVRIINAFPGDSPGSEYDLAGNVINPSIYSNTTIDSLYDGTTDGQFNYSIGHNDSASNFGVFRFDVNWANPVQIFTPDRRSSGITYDQVTNTLWTTATTGFAEYVQNYSMAGVLLSEFPIGINGGYAIAWNPADDTLWIPESFGVPGRLWQYSKTGSLIQTTNVPGLQSNPFGAEFPLNFGPASVPEPTSLIVWGLLAVGGCLYFKKYLS